MPESPSISPETTRVKLPIASANVTKISKRARWLIDALLIEMQEGVRTPSRRTSDHWKALFGESQSLVMNLQKLVQALAVLPEKPVKEKREQGTYASITTDEMAVLKSWLEDQ